MQCTKCRNEIPEESCFCSFCGIRLKPPVRSARKRGNGQGTVYRRKNGKWQAEITLGYSVRNGKKYRKRLTKGGFERKKDAVAYLSVLKADQNPKKQITVSQLWELFRNTRMQQISPSRQRAYTAAYHKIADAVGYRKIDELTVRELQDIVNQFGISYDTKSDLKILFSQLYLLAVRDDYAPKNKAVYIQLPEPVRPEREIFTEREITEIWTDYRLNPSPIAAHLLIMLYTGMRPGELLTIRRENINLEEQYLTGGIKTKKGRNRKIILPDKILPVIRYLMTIKTDGTLTCYQSAYFLRRDWKLKKAELHIRDELALYSCRHTYITRLTRLKLSPAMLQELAGHTDYETTLLYTHLSVADRLLEVNRLS